MLPQHVPNVGGARSDEGDPRVSEEPAQYLWEGVDAGEVEHEAAVPDAELAVARVGRRSSRSAKWQRRHGRASDGASRVREEKRRSSVGMGVSCLVSELFRRFGSGNRRYRASKRGSLASVVQSCGRGEVG